MLVHFNPRCSPPWNDGQLAAKVANAYRYGKLQPGRESPDLFGPVPAAPAPEKSAPIHIGEFMADPKRMTWVVENWIPRQGHTFFSGRGGVGKSTMCLQLAVSIAAGRPWFGMGVTPMPTLVVACEDTQDEVHRRLHVIMNTPEYAGIDYKETPLHVWSRVGFNNIVAVIKDGEGVRPGKYHDELETHLKSMPEGPKFVVLDTIPDVFFGNENDRCSVNAFVKQILGRWEKLYNVTFLCTAHPPKSGAEFSGSTAWEGAFRSRLFCDYADPEHIDEFRTFKVSKANYGKAGTGMTLKRCDDGLFRPCADSEADEGMKQAIIFAVNDADSDGDPLCWSHQSPRCYHKICIKDRDGRPLAEEVVKRLVKEMIQEGRLETHGLSPRELRVVQGIPDSV
jgi:RecA-family ATPase